MAQLQGLQKLNSQDSADWYYCWQKMSRSIHPEAPTSNELELCVHDQLRCSKFLKELEDAPQSDIQQALKLLAYQYFVAQPSAIRFLASEAARNLFERSRE